MSWTSPTSRSTGNLITQSIWNTDLVDNLAYLKNAPTFDGLVTVAGGFVVNGTSSPAAGSGVEIIGGATPAVQAFNRTGGAYLALILDALNHKWKTSNTERWGINAAGDFTVGASSHIVDSVGTPTITSGFSTGIAPVIAGSDYAFVVTSAGTASDPGVVGFGHTWSTTPVCVVHGGNTTRTYSITALSTTSISIGLPGSGVMGNIWVLCRGY